MPEQPDFPIIAKLGGRATVYQHLEEVSGSTKRDTVRMWYARGRISGAFVLKLMRLAELNGISYEASDFQLQTPEADNGASDGSGL